MTTLPTALALLQRLRQVDPDMPMAQAYCLILIALNEGLSLKELAGKADVGMASASRYVSQFSEASAPGKKGLGLVSAFEDPMERRKKVIKLTPKGKSVVHKILGENHASL